MLLSSPAAAQELRPARWWMVSGHATDYITTEWALSQGAREMNPVMRGGPGSRAALHAGMAGIEWLVSTRLERRRPKLAKVLLMTSGIVLHGMAVNNAIVAAVQR